MRRWQVFARRLGPSTLVAVTLASSLGAADFPSPAELASLRAYIKTSWTTLTRSARDLPAAAPDPKLHLAAGERWPVYLPAREDRARIEAELAKALTPAQLASIELLPLPADTKAITRHGLLYMPHPYVVPGGRFNEMYGWDSYFIQVGLLRDGETRARQGHGRQLRLPDRALRDAAEREPDLLSLPLAAAVPHPDAARRLPRDPRPRLASSRAARRREVLPLLDDPAAPDSGARALALLRPGRWAGARGAERRARRAGTHALRPRARVLQDPRDHRLRRLALLRPQGRPPDRPLLQGRPVDARIRVRSLESFWPVQHRHHPLRAGLPERAALPDGA